MTASVPAESNDEVAPRSVGAQARGASFPRSARLLRHADFERVYKLGKRHFSASMTVFYRQRPETVASSARADAAGTVLGARVGFAVSRVLGGAVERNRMKRRLREAVRLTRPAAGVNADVVIHPKKALLTADFSALLNEVRRAFVAIEQELGGRSDASTPD